MKRYVTRASQAAIDLFVLATSLSIAFFLRFDWAPPTEILGRLLLVLPYVVAFEYVILVGSGITRFSWRYVGLREVARILLASVVSGAALLASRLVLGELQYSYPYLRHGLIPIGIIVSNVVFMFVSITGVRVARRWLGERADARSPVQRQEQVVPTMLIGAGQAGVMVAKELANRPELGLRPVGFLDDDPLKQRTTIHGISVLGSTNALGEHCRAVGATQVLITMANVPGSTIRRIRRLCDDAGIPAKIIPGIYEIVGGNVNLSRIRDVAISDLLRRDPVNLDESSVRAFVQDRVVLVTGAGGSIGSGLCRQLARFAPRQLVLLERAENALFHIHRELLRSFPNLDIIPCIADVTDQDRVNDVFAKHRPSVVFHAAAHKHVPMMEWNPGEAVKNNVHGSRTVADASHRFGCAAFVMISTDKAVNPTSIMGATKRTAELYVQTLASQSTTRFVTVRFGNVLGSNGSVVPIFREQIAKGGPVTVTHPEMRRYFMTIPEACQLVLQAGSMGRGGEIFILDMGEPVRIVDLARDLIALSGFREGEDIEIVFTGARPGEKLFEELATDAEHADKTTHPQIFVGKLAAGDPVSVRTQIDRLIAKASTSTDIRSDLTVLVPEYSTPGSNVASAPTAAEHTAATPRALPS